jgi:hypothetical protein
MEPTKQEAETMLADAGQTRRAVHARTPKEHLPFFAWGAFLAIMIPGFDIFDRAVWGWTTIAVAAAGLLATGLYFAARSRDVRVAERTPSWTWVAFSVSICVGGVIAEGLDQTILFSYVLGGVLSAVPLFIWGLHLRREA